MKNFLQQAKDYIIKHNEVFIGVAIVAGGLLIALAVSLIIKANGPNIVYEPPKACDLFTNQEAIQLMNVDRVVSTESNDPVIVKDLATSKCAYSDLNADPNQTLVAALSVRAGINDKGVEQNKSEFKNGKPKSGVQDIKDLGDSAYFNLLNGQLNVLQGRNWYLMSYGVGTSPETNTIEKAVEMAHKVLPKPTAQSKS